MQTWFILILYAAHLWLQGQHVNYHSSLFLVGNHGTSCLQSLSEFRASPAGLSSVLSTLVLTPCTQYILFLLFVLPAASSTVYYIFLFEILVCFFFFPLTSSKKLSLPPAVLLAFWFGRWSFYFQLFWWRFAGPCVCFNTILLSTSCCWITKFANKSGTIVFKLVTHSSVCLCVLWIQYHLSQLKCWLVWHLKIA